MGGGDGIWGAGFGVWSLGSGVWGDGFEVWGLGFEVWGLWLGVWGVGFEVWGLGFGVWGVGCGVWGVGFEVWGLGFKVLSLGFEVLGFGFGFRGLGFGVWDLGFGVCGLGLGFEVYASGFRRMSATAPSGRALNCFQNGQTACLHPTEAVVNAGRTPAPSTINHKPSAQANSVHGNFQLNQSSCVVKLHVYYTIRSLKKTPGTKVDRNRFEAKFVSSHPRPASCVNRDSERDQVHGTRHPEPQLLGPVKAQPGDSRFERGRGPRGSRYASLRSHHRPPLSRTHCDTLTRASTHPPLHPFPGVPLRTLHAQAAAVDVLSVSSSGVGFRASKAGQNPKRLSLGRAPRDACLFSPSLFAPPPSPSLSLPPPSLPLSPDPHTPNP